jgi:hypothetical protein
MALGCGNPDKAGLTHWSDEPREFHGTSGDGFSELYEAGKAIFLSSQKEAESNPRTSKANALTSRTTFFEAQKRAARNVIGNRRSDIERAVAKRIVWVYEPTGFTTPPTYLAGLRLAAKSYIWDIQDAKARGDSATIVSAFTHVTKLGLAMLQGGGYEASLGASLMDEARKELTPVLPILSANELGTLAKTSNASIRNLDLLICVDNELRNMLWGLQQVQDAAAAGTKEKLEAILGVEGAKRAESLKKYTKSRSELKDVFDWIGADIRARTSYAKARIQNPKTAESAPDFHKRSRFMDLHQLLATNLDSLVPKLVSTQAKTKLLILECFLRQSQKLKKRLPDNLSAFSPQSKVDPFTGESFFYTTNGTDFQVYSTGVDGVDDGGKTDANFSAPDLMLER